MRFSLSMLARLAVCAALVLSAASVRGAEPFTAEHYQKLLERLARGDKALEPLQKLPAGQVPEQAKDQRVVLLPDVLFFGNANYGFPQGARFLVGRVVVVNLTPRAIDLKREGITLEVDGKPQPMVDVSPNVRFQSFDVGGQRAIQMQQVELPKELPIPSGGMAAPWVYFGDLPNGSQVPKLALQVKAGEQTWSLDVNASQKRLLALDVARIGPRGCLALLKIGGELNSINIGALVDELDKLSIQKVGRVVIEWVEGSQRPDYQLLSWLQQAAMTAGRGQEQQQSAFPTLPASIRELHLARIPGADGNPQTNFGYNPGAPVRLHATESQAVRSALKTAFESLPRPELLQSIAQGPVLVRAAALATGAGRLPPEHLNVILKYADDPDPQLQEAALAALRHFGDRTAIDKLVEYARKNVEPLSATAVASLAASRYRAAHEALLAILRNEPPEAKKMIVGVLAQHPRPIWGDVLYEYIQEPRAGLNQQALLALQQVGHPKLVEVLTAALRGDDAPLREQAFAILLTRNDDESERAALEYTLEKLETQPPDGHMLQLLTRVKDPRAVPLLLAQLDKTKDRTSLIQPLMTIGDQTVIDQLLARYKKFQPHEQVQVLQTLQRFKTPQFRELARDALLSSDASLVNVAAQGLVEDGGDAAVDLLVQALDKTAHEQSWNYLANALAMAATPAARAALIKMRDSNNPRKRAHGVSGLQQLRQRSPAYQYIYQGQAYTQQKQWKQALENYDVAIQLDPELPEAYVGRGDCYIRQSKFAEATKNYAKALELDPFNAQALTGVCIGMVVDGKLEGGIKKLEAARERFPNDNLFSYNAACVYGRAVEYLQKHPEAADRDKQVAEHTKQALKDLTRAVRQGFRQFDWMVEDPDLKPFREIPEFKELPQKADQLQNEPM